MGRKRSVGALSGDLFDRAAPGAGGGRRRRATRPRSEVGTTELLSPAADPLPVRALKPSINDEAPVSPAEEYFDEPFRDFEFVGGLHLTNSILWFDADRKRDLVFVSHAHGGTIGKNRRILATDKTIRIVTRKSGKIDALTSPYKRGFTIGPLRLEMHPAGHVLGSAQLLVERNERRLVFAPDVCIRKSATVERAAPIPCDALALPPTYGHPMFRFPPRDEVMRDIESFIDRCFEDHATPVLIAGVIGAAQELMRRLGDDGYRMRVHGSIYDVAKIYRNLGVTLNGARRFAGPPAREEVVIFPPILKRHASIRKLRKFRTAIVSGRALEPGFKFKQRVDEVFPFSDTADHSELHDFVDATGASEVYLYGPRYVEDFGAELRKKGIKVIPLVEPKQLNLL